MPVRAFLDSDAPGEAPAVDIGNRFNARQGIS